MSGGHSVVPLHPLTLVLGLSAGALMELWLPGVPSFGGVILDL